MQFSSTRLLASLKPFARLAVIARTNAVLRRFYYGQIKFALTEVICMSDHIRLE